jgi:hypothetical protein
MWIVTFSDKDCCEIRSDLQEDEETISLGSVAVDELVEAAKLCEGYRKRLKIGSGGGWCGCLACSVREARQAYERDKEPRFILVPAGNPISRKYGSIVSDGVLGRVSKENAYLKVYAELPAKDSRKLDDLEVGDCIANVRYRLSGQTGYYDVYRVR